MDGTFLAPEVIRLDLRAAAVRARLPAALMETARLHSWRDETLDHLCVELRAYVLTQHLDSHTETATRAVEFEHPSSWWQHYKRDVLARYRLTRWFVRWRPVRNATAVRHATLSVTWARYASFPEASIVVDPSLGRYRLNVARSEPVWRVTPL